MQSAPNKSPERIFEVYGDMLYRLSLVALRHAQDAEDAVSDTLIKYMCRAPAFKDSEHEKAWLIRVCLNTCRSQGRRRARRDEIGTCDTGAGGAAAESHPVLDAVMALPDKYKAPLYLFYVEEWSTREISQMLGISEAAVRKRLQVGRKLLKIEYEKE